MLVKKKWIMALCCICLASLLCATFVCGSFYSASETPLFANSSKLLEDVTGKYDVSDLTASKFDSSVVKTVDGVELTGKISVIVDLGGKGLYDIYDGKTGFAEFAATATATKYLKTLQNQQSKFIASLGKSGIDYRYRGSFMSVANGVGLEIDVADYYKLASVSGVQNVYLSERYSIPKTITPAENYTPVYSTGVYDSHEVYEKVMGDGMLVAILDTGLDYTHPAFQTLPDMTKTEWNKSKITEIFQREALNSEKLGFTVDDVYYSDKVVYAFDYADDDPDVYPSYSEHGTHVAGIVAGQDTEKTVNADGDTFIGVAPNAQLAIMKVFTDNLERESLGGADAIDILKALDDCAMLGVDVVNMSLGSAGGFTDEKSDAYVTDIYNRIEELGISLIVAAGNEYSSGYGGGNGTNLASNPDSGTVGSPSTYTTALSVASIEGQKAPYFIGNADTNESIAFITNSSDEYSNEIDFIGELYKSLGEDISKEITLPYVVIGGVGRSTNYTSTIRRQFQLQPTIALVKRGDISFADKVQFAQDAGAVAVVIYNNLTGTIRMSLGELKNPIPACSIGLEAGTTLVNNAVSNRGTITISNGYAAGPFMSEFSSWGPTPSLTFKPEITAYGGKILSAVPGGGYDQLSGTSMAAPNMAGMVALMRQQVKQENPDLTNKEINALAYQMLMSTTTMVLNDEGNPYSPRKQGAGLGNLHAAFDTKGYITVEDEKGVSSAKTKIELFDDPQRKGVYELEFTLHNISNGVISYQPKVYNMTETLAINGYTVAEKSHMLNDTDVKVYVGGTLTTGRVQVPANSTVKVKVVLTLGAQGKRYIEQSFKNGMYVEGFVRFEDGQDASGGKTCDIGVPYLAFYGDWADAPMFDYTVFEISESENDSGVEPEDKLKASAAATTPLGRYEDHYIIPLGSYVYQMEETDVAISTSDERAAISMFNGDYHSMRSIYELYYVYAGLLRGAKEMDITIIDTVTGEVAFQNTVYNQRKSYANGGSNLGSPVMLGINPFEWNWNNNTEYQLSMSTKLDWKDGKANKNEFSFKFTVDYEAPTITDYRVRFEPYTENKETKYRIYMDVDVYDNQYSMALMPCFIYNGVLTSLTHYPIPIYSQKNDTTTVSFEITDYYEDYFLAGNLFLYPLDYAMNHSLYRVGANRAVDYPESITFENDGSKFRQTRSEVIGNSSVSVYRLTLAPNELFKLNPTTSPDGTIAHKLTWSVPKNSTVKAEENEIFAGNEECSGVQLLLMAGDKALSKIYVDVSGEARNEPSLVSLSFQTVVNALDYVTPVGSTLTLNNNTQTTLRVKTDPWYFGDPELTWSSDNEDVATVDENGVVSTHQTGIAWITATSQKNTAISKMVRITVRSDYDVRNYTLYNYYGGEDCDIPDQLNIMYLDEECFQYNTTVRSIKLPKTLTEIPKTAFMGCTNLETITIPASCKAVLMGAFYGCENLKTVILEKFQNKVDNDWATGTINIGQAVFAGCSSLTTIENQERITTLGEGAFVGCTSLTEIDLSGLRVCGPLVFSGMNIDGIYLPPCVNLKDVTVSAQTVLGENMFYGCTGLEKVTIDSLIVPYGAFANCTNLKTVTFGDKVTLIDDYAFRQCTNLQTITLPNCDHQLGANAFEGCSSLTTVNVPEKAYITNSLIVPFTDCKALQAINVDKDNTNYSSVDGILCNKNKTAILFVPVAATYNESNLEFKNVVEIGASAFAGNTTITSVTLSKYDKVGAYAFANTAITSVTIPASWTEIPAGIFYGCDSLTTVEIEQNSQLVSIEIEAFADCSKLLTVNQLPSTLREIGEAAFMNCSSLTSLEISNVTDFGAYALSGTGIKDLDVSAAERVADFAFFSMKKLETVALGPVKEMGAYVFCDSVATSSGTSVVGNSSIKKVTIKAGAKVIGDYAFANTLLSNGTTNGRLTEVELQDGTTDIEIGAYAFLNRKELTSINLSNVVVVGDQAFLNTGLTSVNLDKVEKIGIGAFAYTSDLLEVNLASAKEIGGSAFESSGIKTLTMPNVEIIDEYAFVGTKITKVVIPASLKTLTFNDEWKELNDAGDWEDVKGKKTLRIGGGAFMSMDSLTEFVVEAGNDVFFANNGVLYANLNSGEYLLVQYPAGKKATEYEVLEGTVRIGDNAFNGDKNLKKVTLPVSLKAIGAKAFFDSKVEEYVFKAVEAPILESSYVAPVTTYSTYDELNEYILFNGNAIGMATTIYYANFGGYAAMVIEEQHIEEQKQWLTDMGENVSGITFTPKTFNYKLTRPENGEGYDTPIWKAYFTDDNTVKSAYAPKRTTQAAINAIDKIKTAEEIRNEVAALSTNQEKINLLNSISGDLLRVARRAYNVITDDAQKALVTRYNDLLMAEAEVRALKASCGSTVALDQLRMDGYPKLRYEAGEKFDPLDMKITAIYEDESLLELTAADYTIDKTGALKVTDTEVIISYGGKTIAIGINVEGDPDTKPQQPGNPVDNDVNVGLIVGLSVGGAAVIAAAVVLTVLILKGKIKFGKKNNKQSVDQNVEVSEQKAESESQNVSNDDKN